MKNFFLATSILLLGLIPAKATHNIAGEITYTCIQDNEYEITVTTYTHYPAMLERWNLMVYFGDGDSILADRSNGVLFNGPNGEGEGIVLANFGAKKSEYKVRHTYNPGSYWIYMIDPNRVAGISNIPNSVNVPFYLTTFIVVDPNVGCNSSPQLTNPPLDKACVGACFNHNPGAYDLDGDSLAFKKGMCLGIDGNPLPGYEYPDDNSQAGGTLNIDPQSGDLAWCSPMVAGQYNLVIYIEQWKKNLNGEYGLIGTVLRDMSIDVSGNCNNQPPVISDIPDLCVDAGSTVNFSFTVSDTDNDSVYVSGFGGPFNVVPGATVNPDSVFLASPVNENFNWQTTCDRVRLQPWTVTFKASDDGGPLNNGTVLTDIESVNITVVSPGPATLSAIPQGSAMNVSWSQSPCDPTSNRVVGYRIYRRQGSSFWMPAQCETGVPATTGFVLIATVGGLANTTYIDNNGGAGLIPGVNYCYRVHTFFVDGAESYASPEACNELLRDVPVITNVDVTSTDVNTGTIDVRWINPITDTNNLDTILHPGPYVLNVLRENNSFTLSSGAIICTTYVAQFFTQLPTLYQDVNRNTEGEPYTYRIDFFASNGADTIGNSQPASSVLLSTAVSDNTISLSWHSITPWTNYEYAIFRKNDVTGMWDSIGLATTTNYDDINLVNGHEYCYFVKSHGSYYNASLPSPLYNRSQENCNTPVDLTPPAAPVLGVHSDCFIGLNQLIWTNPNNMNTGTDDVVSYNIWFTPVEGGAMSVIATVMLSGDTILNFPGLTSVAGCYAVTALDTFGNQSAFSNVICVDNCPDYTLPNVFSPNADGTNDHFVPFPYHYVESVDMKIFDRWGVLVFQTSDPDIMWDGRNMANGKICTDGVYYYTCTVNEIRLQGIVPRQISGFFHLFGEDVRPE